MLEELLQLDSNLLVYLNGLGSSWRDPIWLAITRQVNWTPLFLFILYVMYKKLGLEQTLLAIGVIAFMILITDQTTNLVKGHFGRLRPTNNILINTGMRQVQMRYSFSFWSGHAANSMAVVLSVYLISRKYIKYICFFFFWSLIFAYSRIYLGLHYPGDILTGFLFGAIMAFLGYLLFNYLNKKYLIPRLAIKNSAVNNSNSQY